MRQTGVIVMAAVMLMSMAAGIAVADEATVTAKLSAAKEAAGAGRRTEAAQLLGEAAKALTEDTAGAGEYAVETAAWQAAKIREAAQAIAEARDPGDGFFEISAARIEYLYGALVPYSKGDIAATLDFVRKTEKESGGIAKERLATLGRALEAAAEDSAAKPHATGLLYATVGSTLLLARAMEDAKAERYRQGGKWMAAAVDYLKFEAKRANEYSSDEMREIVLETGPRATEMSIGAHVMDADILDVMTSVEEAVVDAYTTHRMNTVGGRKGG